MFDLDIRNTALNINKSLVIQAPAGSGKTTLLTQRFKSLLKNNKPESILALTFTKKAAKEMQERILNLSDDLQYPANLKIMTLDSFAYNILKSSKENLNNFQIVTNPTFIYEKAAINCLENLPADFYLYFDNQYDYMVQMLCDLLANREQWLPIILNGGDALDVIIANIENSILDEFNNRFGEFLYELTHDKLLEFLLTKTGTIRKRLPSTAPKHLKASLKNLIDNLTSNDKYIILSLYKAPKKFKDNVIFTKLYDTLPTLVAELYICFEQAQKYDYTQVTLNAIKTLQEEPGVLAELENSISHILVDEVQDTSTLHLSLITELAKDWDIHKTLFFVGDPMQSIYGFRHANPKMMYEIPKKFINHNIEILKLTSNFRTGKNIVNFINKTMVDAQNLLIKPNQNFFVKAWPQIDKNSYIKTKLTNSILKVIDLEIKHPGTIGIIAPYKKNLKEIAKHFQANNVSFIAHDLVSLHDKTFDLLTITKILLNPNDYTSWLSFLRSPFVGLKLSELILIDKENVQNSIKSLINEKLHKVMPVILKMFKGVDKSLSLDLIDIYHNLNIYDFIPINYFDSYLKICQETNNIIELESNLLKELVTVNENDAKIELLTIHKAKGLEFDKVILIGFENSLSGNSSSLINWYESPYGHIFSATKGINTSHNPVFSYINFEKGLDNEVENVRLLYVALTRTKTNLTFILKNKPSPKSLLNYIYNDLKDDLIIKDFNAVNDITKDYNILKVLKSSPNIYENEYVDIKLNSNFTGSDFGKFMHRILELTINEVKFTLEDCFTQTLINRKYKEKFIQKASNIITKMQDDKYGAWLLKTHTQDKTEYILNHVSNIRLDRVFLYNDKRWIVDYKTGHLDINKAAKQLKYYQKIWFDAFKEKANIGIYHLDLQKWIEID